MMQGVGVRLTDYGARLISLERGDSGLRVTGLAAGPRDEVVTAFLAQNRPSASEYRVVVGLGPGDYLTSTFQGEPGMSPDDIRSQLRWELEQKILTPPSEYNFDFLVAGDHGFGFAGRRKRISDAVQSWGGAITDVEPVALYNACETLAGLGDGVSALVAIESEGITVVVVSGKLLVSLDSVIYRDQGISTILAGLDQKQISEISGEETSRLFEYIRESIDRVTSFGGDSYNPTPRNMILAGTGMYVPDIPALLEKRYSIAPVLSDPFSVIHQDIGSQYPALFGMGGAFLTGFGLALRALEG